MKKKTAGKSQFSEILLKWHDNENKREMPWKGEKDPYKIWLSEIILQQTRVEQGLAYYLRFIEKYPTIFELAAAPDMEVFKLWEGLGYYSRCRNLLHTARFIVDRFNGRFPASYDGLLELKGVGSYTAAAIASFAFELPFAVVDGNVLRVLARYFGVKDPVNETVIKEKLTALAQSLLSVSRPAAYNQAIMDFGATVCKPQNPACSNCPFQKDCTAFQGGLVDVLPVKTQKPPRKERFFLYFIISYKGMIWIRERTEKDIWRHLFEFFLVECSSKEGLEPSMMVNYMESFGWQVQSVVTHPEIFRQLLTHQEISTSFVWVTLKKKPHLPPDGKWVEQNEIGGLAFPQTIQKFLQQNKLTIKA
ncbi:MAG: A/G-specific adenine glycosylase [Chitinophagaceae bacterium]|nr:A/G-specific adenine glycosylase [Chitinophagaceae bacterium]